MIDNDALFTNSLLLKDPINFSYALKTLKDKGNLVYEYNPFRNYRLNKSMLEYKGKLYEYQELNDEYGIELKGYNDTDIAEFILNAETIQWEANGSILNVSESPILRRKGELVDFDTSLLGFDLTTPVSILPLYSYDGSVNLILNDGKNLPRLINSRFSATERNLYLIVDRKGDNDTNIYDLGEEFDIDTSLHKKTKTIPTLKYLGTFSSGNLSIGNYHFYFKYLDADGNESDFIAESGLVSIFIGNTPYNIHTGFREENSHKGVAFTLKNLDSGYLYLSVYYTKASSDILENSTISAYKIDLKFLINSANMSLIKITGFEHKTEIPIDDINLLYLLFNDAKALATCLNRLFLGNTSSPDINYKELSDIALRFCPFYTTLEYDIKEKISEQYEPKSLYNNSYYDSKYIYNNVGYWPGEIYRFGIVYILNDGTLTPVFNTRGIEELPNINLYKDEIIGPFTLFNFAKDRQYISYNEETNAIITSLGSSTTVLENCKGVVKFPEDSSNKIFGVLFILGKERNEILTSLKELGIRGYFFVRLKRIPTILCLALTIGVDKLSHTPVIPYNGNYIAECFLSNKNRTLTHNYDLHEYIINSSLVDKAAICPEYDIDYPYYNVLFSGDSFTIAKLKEVKLKRLSWNKRYYYEDDVINLLTPLKDTVQILAIEDNLKLAAIDNIMFSARAGEAEEVRHYEYVSVENKTTEASNLLRGSFGPFLGLNGSHFESSLINIYIPGYSDSNLQDYFLIRYNDKAPFYAISDRKSLDSYNENDDYYQGDCYICLFTHRVNRNFLDPSAPTNDLIVDENCWKNNWEMENGIVKVEKIDKINLGDLNAVLLGQWVTFTIRSTKNLNIRSLDNSNVDESALVGHSRGFYPYLPLSTRGVYKIPEALCYNKGFEKSTSERYNFESPDVPALKNDFSNRISYSDIAITDAFLNGFRTFRATNYRDYPKTYGSITKLVELRNNLICVFEHGIGLIPVNERTVAGEGSGGNVYINTSNVLPENIKIISDTFGSQWKDSVIKTPRGVYGVDTVGKKIWRTNGEEFECISDFRVQEFLNKNISLTERELKPIIGIRNVKTHYNLFKGDVMFTFYDNLYGFEEKVWNLCWNENLLGWITFYSWVPSYSENFYNLYFSFDRNTSKWITKLGVSSHGNCFSDGITLGKNIIENINDKITLYLDNRNILKKDDIVYDVTYELVRDNYGNYKLFNDPVKTDNIDEKTGLPIWEISLNPKVTYDLLCSEYYARVYNDCFLDDLSIDENGNEVFTAPLISDPNTRITLPKGLRTIWKETLGTLKVYKNDKNRRINLASRDKDKRVNGNKVVILLNIKATLKAKYIGKNNIISEEISEYNKTLTNDSYYQSVVAVIPKYNMLFLTTDFWKHGLAGIIDIADKIYPTYWYGKQHPFEFEFVVANRPDTHKIFDSLEIISNKAAPESFHYEIVGECYDFAKDKKNMYIRLEATKELYQFNGSDIVFNPDYKDLISEHRPLTLDDPDPKHYDKSTIFPLYYYRLNTINEIEDFYHLYGHKDRYGKGDKNFSALSGAEIVRYENLDEYRIWNHAKAVDITKNGLLRGNMYYKEDKWYVQINPLNFVQKNESKDEWLGTLGATKLMVPAEYNLFPIPLDIKDKGLKHGITLPDDWTRNVISWDDYQKRNQEAKMKDKFIKIRIRYSGEDLAIISSILTLYSISYA